MTKNKETKEEFENKVQQNLDSEVVKDAKKVKEKDYSSLEKQVQSEYSFAYSFMKPKLDENLLRLKLYNNQKRDKKAIGDPLLFTIHQTVLASLYSDQLTVSFLGREQGDEDAAENLNNLAKFDYDEMEKDIFDYYFDWDASFFNHALAFLMYFDRKKKIPIPELIDPMTWLRDPEAISANGDINGRGAMKYGGREIRLTINELKNSKNYFNVDRIKTDSASPDSLIDNYGKARNSASGYSNNSKKEVNGENKSCRLVEWLTIWNGKKVLVTLANKRKLIVRYHPLGKEWEIIDRLIYPISHSWDGVSIPDLVEDKQRARSVVQNLAIKGIKAGLQPQYLYDSNKIKNRAHLNLEFNKFIPVDGSPAGSVEEMKRQQVKQEANWILETLDTASQRATSTPEAQQGITSQEKRTATEMNMLERKVDTRYSLSAKIFGWSDKRFWRLWYSQYKKNFKEDIDEKILRIVGAGGSKWRTLTRENIIANVDPDIKIESLSVSEANKFNQLQMFRAFIKDTMAIDPNTNWRFALKHLGRLSGFDKDIVDKVLPLNVDELKAEEENEVLNSEKLVKVNIDDNDLIHMDIHSKAADTPQKYSHIQAHKEAMIFKRDNPQFSQSPEMITPKESDMSGIMNDKNKDSLNTQKQYEKA